MSQAPAAQRRRPWSITVRLVGLQVLAVTLLIGSALIYLQQTITSHLDADDREVLAQQATLLRNWFEDPNTQISAIMRQISTPVGGPVATQFFFIRILDMKPQTPRPHLSLSFPSPAMPSLIGTSPTNPITC